MEHPLPLNQGKRPYHSRTRQRQAEETRRRILAATRELFASRGYAGTTLEAIAGVAEVSPKTVSATFGSKRTLLAALINPNAFGTQLLHLLDKLRATPEPLQRIALVAQITRQAYESLTPELELLRTAGAVAPELTDLAQEVEARRRQNQARLVGYLNEHQALRPDLPIEEVIDLLWALTSYDLYRMLVIERRWLPERYETWLAQLLTQHLLPPALSP